MCLALGTPDDEGLPLESHAQGGEAAGYSRKPAASGQQREHMRLWDNKGALGQDSVDAGSYWSFRPCIISPLCPVGLVLKTSLPLFEVHVDY